MRNKNYKRTKLQGIYKIENIKNGKIYIGSSNDINNRWNTHLSELMKNTHHNYKLQNDFNEYGYINFNFSILEITYYIDVYKLHKLETDYIIKYNSIYDNIGYNLSLPVKKDLKNISRNIHKNINLTTELKYIKKNMEIIPLTSMKKFTNDNYYNLVNDEFAFSHNWYIKSEDNCTLTRKMLLNLFRKYFNVKSNELYWTTYIDIKDKLKDKGYTKGYINAYGKDIKPIKRNTLAYCCNIYQIDNIENEEYYSFKCFILWILRVCDIKKPFKVFIPSNRMVNIINKYLSEVNL